MSLCDRCTAGMGCCLNYLGAACKRYRDRECPDVQPTNADRIRAMSDEELIDFFRSKEAFFLMYLSQEGIADWIDEPYKPAPEEGEQCTKT